MNYLSIANGFPMWIAAGIPVSIVIIQAIIFVRKSYETGRKMGIREDQFRSAVKSSFFSAIGPSLVVVGGMLTLLVTMGGPISWLRLSFIGSAPFELLAASFGAQAVGAQFGTESMTNIAFANGVWTMILSSLGWLIFTALFADKMDNMKDALAGGRKELVPVVSLAALLGAFAYVNVDKILVVDKVTKTINVMHKSTYAILIGAVAMALLTVLAEKSGKQWINEWSITIAMFFGMVATQLF